MDYACGVNHRRIYLYMYNSVLLQYISTNGASILAYLHRFLLIENTLQCVIRLLVVCPIAREGKLRT